MARQAHGALWEDRLQVYGEKPCAETGDARCVPYRIEVRNDSERPVECHLRVGTSGYGDIVVTAHDINQSRDVLLPADAPAPSFSSECKLIPSTLPPRPADACETETTLAYPEDYYPPGLRRRFEGGETVVDISLSEKNRIRAFRVVRSSGWQGIDTAALTVVKALRYAPGCGGKTVRRAVLFEVRKPDNCYGGCVTPLNEIAASVSVFGIE